MCTVTHVGDDYAERYVGTFASEQEAIDAMWSKGEDFFAFCIFYDYEPCYMAL
jgi:hypothetical protein